MNTTNSIIPNDNITTRFAQEVNPVAPVTATTRARHAKPLLLGLLAVASSVTIMLAIKALMIIAYVFATVDAVYNGCRS